MHPNSGWEELSPPAGFIRLAPCCFVYALSVKAKRAALGTNLERSTALCAACEKWDLWLYGQEITVHSDHQPLEIIFRKPVGKAPKRLQKIMLRLQRYKLGCVQKRVDVGID